MKLTEDTIVQQEDDIIYPLKFFKKEVVKQILENQEKAEKCPHLEIEIQTLQNIVAKHYEENKELKEIVEKIREIDFDIVLRNWQTDDDGVPDDSEKYFQLQELGEFLGDGKE